MSVLPELGESGVKRSFLRQLVQVALLVALGISAGVFVANREHRLTNLETLNVRQDSILTAREARITTVELAVHSVNRRLCNIERAVRAEIDETCPPKMR